LILVPQPEFFLIRIYPELVQALNMTPIKTAPYYRTAEMQSRAGSKFVSFAKTRKFQKELYEDLVCPHYSAGDYYVEAWRHGTGNIGSDCDKPSKVYNIEEISFPSLNFTFKTMRDHSKWMVSNEHKLICVGDINRQEHQKVRGGGTVCQETNMSSAYANLVKAVEKCKKPKKQVRFSNHVDEIPV
jgi:deoxyribonuclease II